MLVKKDIVLYLKDLESNQTILAGERYDWIAVETANGKEIVQ